MNEKMVVKQLILLLCICSIPVYNVGYLIWEHASGKYDLYGDNCSPFTINANKQVICQTDQIVIVLVSPLNGSINRGGTTIFIDFRDENDTPVMPVTELYRWDHTSNFESILRPLPMEDGEHSLEVEVESGSGIWSIASFIFYSDNNPPEIALISPENKTHQVGGTNPIIWDSTYASGSLPAINSYDIDFDGICDILAGGANGRVYAYHSIDGNIIWLSSQQTSAIISIIKINTTMSLLGLTEGKIQTIKHSDGANVWSNSSITSTVKGVSNENSSEQLIILNEHELRSFDYEGLFNWNVAFLYNDYKEILLLEDFMGDSHKEIVVINQSSFIQLYNITDGSQISNFTLSGNPEDAIIYDGFLYISNSDGYVTKCNVTEKSIEWTALIGQSTNIYQIERFDSYILCTTGDGRLVLVDDSSGEIIHQAIVSANYIKFLSVSDFDHDNSPEAIVFDGGYKVYNVDALTLETHWNFSLGHQLTNIVLTEFNNDTFNDIVVATTDGYISVIDPRAQIPYLVHSWTNITIAFQDDISGTTTCWEKYSWDEGDNQSTVGTIPSTSGIHTLDVWVCDNASNVQYAHYEFFAAFNIKLNSPLNGSYQQSGTVIDMTFSEEPLFIRYKWDEGSYSSVLAPLPTPEIQHKLYILVKDQSQTFQTFHYQFMCDDTPISSISLQAPMNDSLVEGGEEIIIYYSEIPFIEYYSWDNLPNVSTIDSIPQDSDTHTLDVFVADAALNWYTQTFVFHTKIRICLESHLNNSIVDPFDMFNFSFGENPDYYEYSFDGDSYTGYSDHNTTFNITIPTESKTHYLTIRANDSSNGIWNEETYVFITKLTMNLTSHIDGGFAETGDPLIIEYSDIPITRLFSWDGEKNSSRNPIVPSPDGWHTLDIYLGNIKGMFWHYHFEFNVDTILIDILLITPINNSRVNSWENLTITFSETPYQVFYSWDNTSPQSIIDGFPTTDGIHTLNVTVYDQATNMNSKTFTWIIDDTPIKAVLNDFTNNSSVYTGETLNITFQETPKVVWFQWDSNAFSPSLPPVPMQNGTHILNITTYDGLNWNIEYFTFTVIDLPPDFSLIDAERPHQTNILLSVTVNETIGYSWHYWDNNSKISGLEIITPLEEGTHKLTIFIEDLGKSNKTKVYFIIIDNTPITIIEIDPRNNSRVDIGLLVNITYNETPYSITYSWDNQERTENLTIIPETGGDHFLHIRAYDEAGNVLEATVCYHIGGSNALSPLVLVIPFSIITVGIVVFRKFQYKLKKPRQIDG